MNWGCRGNGGGLLELKKFGLVFRRKFQGLFHEGALVCRVQLRRGRRAIRHRDTDLREELFLAGWRADAEQPRRLPGFVSKRVRCVRWNMDSLLGADHSLLGIVAGSMACWQSRGRSKMRLSAKLCLMEPSKNATGGQ